MTDYDSSHEKTNEEKNTVKCSYCKKEFSNPRITMTGKVIKRCVECRLKSQKQYQEKKAKTPEKEMKKEKKPRRKYEDTQSDHSEHTESESDDDFSPRIGSEKIWTTQELLRARRTIELMCKKLEIPLGCRALCEYCRKFYTTNLDSYLKNGKLKTRCIECREKDVRHKLCKHKKKLHHCKDCDKEKREYEEKYSGSSD